MVPGVIDEIDLHVGGGLTFQQPLDRTRGGYLTINSIWLYGRWNYMRDGYPVLCHMSCASSPHWQWDSRGDSRKLSKTVYGDI